MGTVLSSINEAFVDTLGPSGALILHIVIVLHCVALAVWIAFFLRDISKGKRRRQRFDKVE